ncbi:sporulation protein [Bacillus mangrovi]|uniref:Sporulation protein n=1 Tax=Metabacillus mangrovi TaxID=1491830 RepID=A0A7X2S5N6_9BACI|nr:YhcN/YlaJ family sporulation lipoprotein [Metabacillus mangrovi]MTH53872.1 sporulation protein [Metabacillus mangrovi]
MKRLYVTGMVMLAVISSAGCRQAGEEGKSNLTDENGSTIQVDENTKMYQRTGNESKKEERTEAYGFVRHSKKDLMKNGEQTEYYGIDRKELADTISGLTVQLPGISEAATLVTDEEVLVAYRRASGDRSQMADMVKRTAISVVPRYYHVYISDNPAYFDQLQSYSRMDSESRDADAIIGKLTNGMKKDSPQGKAVNKGENANGEETGEMSGDGMER